LEEGLKRKTIDLALRDPVEGDFSSYMGIVGIKKTEACKASSYAEASDDKWIGLSVYSSPIRPGRLACELKL